ncbi:flagellar hook-associated protein FlgL [Salibacterium halotolerans]|uniref:Flagellar hook-associated protein 3 FlgL n=1 Tax=Salibacterium halotolerans TaxID=1884432 RepID=A0A1I5WYF5_9BACI|nr:flagellar hook-associated protein FlgL [Salibacterium halotolerans]SFQ24773.1 flagellar hook-associated protein 3 FlgL [Salibacterium halotolerans]
MRVTQSMLTQNSLQNLQQSNERLGILQEQLSTGKKITKASQDPVIAMSGIRYRGETNQIQQFQRNVGEMKNWMNSTDSALDKSTEALQRVRELTTQAANDTYEEGQRENIAEEVAQLRNHIGDMANTKMNGKYIFNGTNTQTAPVDDNGNTNFGDGEVEMELMDGVKIKANSNPKNTFGNGLFNTLSNLEEDLRDDSKSGEDIGEYLDDVDSHINDMVNERAEVGARQNRVEMIESRLGQQEVTAKEIMSENEDADMAKVIMNLTTQESVHKAALSASARIIQPTLLDFLR